MICGPANCGKTFMFQALSSIYNTFTNPASGTFAWVGAELVEVIFLNDFRWSPKVIPWNDMLLLKVNQFIFLHPRHTLCMTSHLTRTHQYFVLPNNR